MFVHLYGSIGQLIDDFLFLIIIGTNDKAGGSQYLLRFASIQSVKETYKPLTAWEYPSMS
jgi:hypothetical protein